MLNLSIPSTPIYDLDAVVSTAPHGLRNVFAADGPSRIEAAEDYAGLLAALVEGIAPRDVVEWIWVKDIADLAWEARRAGRAKAVALTLARRRALGDLRMADVANADAGEINGQAYGQALDEIERFDRLVTVAGMRRDAVLRDLEQRRARIRAMRERAIANQRD